MVYSLAYRRPSRVSHVSSRESLSGAEKTKSIHESVHSGSSGMSHGIPEALSFDRIIAGGTCPVSNAPHALNLAHSPQPCTTRDFMNYLKYIELAAENLQFYLWFRSYTKRFNDLPDNEKALSPPWTAHDAEQEQARPKRVSPETQAIFKGTDFANEPKIAENEKNPFFTPPPGTPNSDLKRDGRSSIDSYDGSLTSGGKTDHTQRATGAFESAGLKWKPREFD